MNREDREELKMMIEDALKPVVGLLEEHHRTLFGDGSDAGQGLRVHVDRINQDRRRSDRHFWILYPALAGMVLKSLWDWIASHAGRAQ